MKVLGLCGSLRARSINAALLRTAAALAPPGMQVTLFEGVAELPLFNQDLESVPPAAVQRLRAAVTEADALLVASPELAHGISGVMKNTLDWLVSLQAFQGKPVALWNTQPRAEFSDTALRETLRVMSARLVEPASVAFQLTADTLTEAGMRASPAVAGQVLAALAALRRGLDAAEPATSFYDALAPLYHLVYPDWPASVRRQGEQLSALLQREWPLATPQRQVLDVACGIGTQALGLAQQGHAVTASDLSPAAVARAREEAARQGLDIAFSVADMRAVHAHHGSGFDTVLCADNSLPHLLTEPELRQALQQMHDCLAPGGGCVITVRDYAAEPRGRHIVKPYGVREQAGKRFLLFQVWNFEPRPAVANGAAQADLCHIAFFFVEEDLASQAVHTHVMRSVYHAVPIDTLLQAMRAVGFQDVRRLDDVFYQPVLAGTRCVAVER